VACLLRGILTSSTWGHGRLFRTGHPTAFWGKKDGDSVKWPWFRNEKPGGMVARGRRKQLGKRRLQSKNVEPLRGLGATKIVFVVGFERPSKEKEGTS